MIGGTPDSGSPLNLVIRRLERLVCGTEFPEGLRDLALTKLRLVHCELEEKAELERASSAAVAAAASRTDKGKEAGPVVTSGEPKKAPEDSAPATKVTGEKNKKRSRSRRRRRKKDQSGGNEGEKGSRRATKGDSKKGTRERSSKRSSLPSVTPPAPSRDKGASKSSATERRGDRHQSSRQNSPGEKGRIEHKSGRKDSPEGTGEESLKEKRTKSPEKSKGRSKKEKESSSPESKGEKDRAGKLARRRGPSPRRVRASGHRGAEDETEEDKPEIAVKEESEGSQATSPAEDKRGVVTARLHSRDRGRERAEEQRERRADSRSRSERKGRSPVRSPDSRGGRRSPVGRRRSPQSPEKEENEEEEEGGSRYHWTPAEGGFRRPPEPVGPPPGVFTRPYPESGWKSKNKGWQKKARSRDIRNYGWDSSRKQERTDYFQKRKQQGR